jgi:SAM-dependent methyltransferase
VTIELESRTSGQRLSLPVADWSAAATDEELALLDSVRPAVLDIGCGPGRIAHGLGARGIPALGIDVAPAALVSAARRGATVLERSVFDRLPGEGRWGTALLFDGNIGIGGDPVALLGRCGELLVAGGDLLVEVAGPGAVTGSEQVRLCSRDGEPGPWFCWATVSVDKIETVAAAAGLCMGRVECRGDRYFAWLRVLRPSHLEPVECRDDPRVDLVSAQPAAVEASHLS